MRLAYLAFVVLVVGGYANADIYTRTACLSGQSFLDAFSWQAIVDPTHGRVDYVDQSTAEENGLYAVFGDSVILRADSTTVLDPDGPGRKSFRLMSHNQYANHVAIFDIGHMPEGCGTWPAVFGNVSNWPNNGEIDIVEGVNNEPPNKSTLHTGPNCTMPTSRPMTGMTSGTDCNANVGNGCGVEFADPRSFGPNFNGIGGGWYAIERSFHYVSVYFWERDSPCVPPEVVFPGYSVDTSTWGTPAAYFPDTDCDFSTHLGPMNIIINLTFCGDWAGNAYSSSGCPSTCVDFVNQNPWAFAEAFFEFNALNIYE